MEVFWIPGINRLKSYGRWAFVELKEVYQIENEFEAKRVLLFEIPAAPQATPVAFKGHWYGRDGESLVPLSLPKMERRLIICSHRSGKQSFLSAQGKNFLRYLSAVVRNCFWNPCFI